MADITISGNATADAALRFTSNGTAVLNFDVAENHRKKQGEQWVDDGTTFYRVAVWGHKAEAYAGHILKGSKVLVSGRFRGGEFTAKTGEQVKTYEVTADFVGLVPKPERDQQQSYEPPQGQRQPQQGWGQPADHQNQWDSPQSSEVPF